MCFFITSADVRIKKVLILGFEIKQVEVHRSVKSVSLIYIRIKEHSVPVM